MKLTYWIVGIVYGMISSIIRLYYTDTLFSSPINTLLDIYINSTLYSIGYEIVGSFINSIIPPKLHNYVLYFLICIIICSIINKINMEMLVEH